MAESQNKRGETYLTKTGKEQYTSVKNAIRRNDERLKDLVDDIRLRVPKGWKEQMKAYVAASDKYDSVNGMICDLIRREIGIKD